MKVGQQTMFGQQTELGQQTMFWSTDATWSTDEMTCSYHTNGIRLSILFTDDMSHSLQTKVFNATDECYSAWTVIDYKITCNRLQIRFNRLQRENFQISGMVIDWRLNVIDYNNNKTYKSNLKFHKPKNTKLLLLTHEEDDEQWHWEIFFKNTKHPNSNLILTHSLRYNPNTYYKMA